MFTTIGIYFVKINDSVKIQRGIEHSILQLFAWTRFMGTKFTITPRSRMGKCIRPPMIQINFPTQETKNQNNLQKIKRVRSEQTPRTQ
jgi:hypothetical protein